MDVVVCALEQHSALTIAMLLRLHRASGETDGTYDRPLITKSRNFYEEVSKLPRAAASPMGCCWPDVPEFPPSNAYDLSLPAFAMAERT